MTRPAALANGKACPVAIGDVLTAETLPIPFEVTSIIHRREYPDCPMAQFRYLNHEKVVRELFEATALTMQRWPYEFSDPAQADLPIIDIAGVPFRCRPMAEAPIVFPALISLGHKQVNLIIKLPEMGISTAGKHFYNWVELTEKLPHAKGWLPVGSAHA